MMLLSAKSKCNGDAPKRRWESSLTILGASAFRRFGASFGKINVFMKEVIINKLTKLSEHFTLGELIKTKTGIENVPNEEQVNNLKRLCGWLEKLRKRWNDIYGEGDDPIIINSGFRSPEVNKAVGGATLSNHLTGCAVDIRCIGIEQALRYAAILLDISDLNNEDFDELLIEQKTHVYWIHFAVKPSCNRRRTNFKR